MLLRSILTRATRANAFFSNPILNATSTLFSTSKPSIEAPVVKKPSLKASVKPLDKIADDNIVTLTSLNEEEEGSNLNDYPISEKTKARLSAIGINALFPIQSKTFHPIYSGEDVLGKARTGTGKTIAFLLPLIEKLQAAGENQMSIKGHKILILTPTRELARQISDELEKVAPKFTKACIFGGVSYGPQERALSDKCDVLIACPGRLNDLITRKIVDFSSIHCTVLDEADVMLNMGFTEATEQILEEVKKQLQDNGKGRCQTLLFSATIPPWVQSVTKKFLRKPFVTVDLVGNESLKTSEEIEHFVITVTRNKLKSLGDVVTCVAKSGRTIIFADTKDETQKIANGIAVQDCAALNGDMTQQQRDQTISRFREGTVRCLVATDVASRGLDFPEVDLVVCVRPPTSVDAYIHRSGRTGRAGRKGVSVIFDSDVSNRESTRLGKIGGFNLKKMEHPSPSQLAEANAQIFVKKIMAVTLTGHYRHDKFKGKAHKLVEKLGDSNAVAAAIIFLSRSVNFDLDDEKMGVDDALQYCMEEMNNIAETDNLSLFEEPSKEILKNHPAVDVVANSMLCFFQRYGSDRAPRRDSRGGGGGGGRYYEYNRNEDRGDNNNNRNNYGGGGGGGGYRNRSSSSSSSSSSYRRRPERYGEREPDRDRGHRRNFDSNSSSSSNSDRPPRREHSSQDSPRFRNRDNNFERGPRR